MRTYYRCDHFQLGVKGKGTQKTQKIKHPLPPPQKTEQQKKKTPTKQNHPISPLKKTKNRKKKPQKQPPHLTVKNTTQIDQTKIP